MKRKRESESSCPLEIKIIGSFDVKDIDDIKGDPYNLNHGKVWSLGSGELLVSNNRPTGVLHRLKIRQPLARALLAGLHNRCGRKSIFSSLSSLFDFQVLRVPLRLAGVLFKLKA